ncbi:hypothetical protein BDW68DRAFT_63869 [Aspergillus falconensis]
MGREDREVEASDKRTESAGVDCQQPIVPGCGRIMPVVSWYNTWDVSGTTFRGGLLRTFSVGQTLSRRDYTVGLICVLHIELAAVRAMLDEIHTDLPVPRSDPNTYILGRMCSHKVVITCLPNGIYGSVPERLMQRMQREALDTPTSEKCGHPPYSLRSHCIRYPSCEKWGAQRSPGRETWDPLRRNGSRRLDG